MSHVVEPQRSAEPAPAGAPANGTVQGKPALPERINGHAPDAPRRSLLLRAVGWLLGLSLLGGTIYLTATRIVAQQAGKSKGPPPAKVIPVVTAEARSADLDLHLSGLGTVTASNTVTVRSRVEGELNKVAFSEGQNVEQGQLLAEIDPLPYQAALDQALGQLAKDQAALEAARLELARSKALVGSRAVTQQQLDADAALVKQNEGLIAGDQALVDMARLRLGYCRITAPISGRIGLRTVDEGNMVQANSPTGLAVITQLQPIAVVFTIPQDDIPRVQRRLNEGQQLVVEAFDRSFRELLATGTLSALDNQVDSTTGTLRLKAIFPNENGALFPNQFVNARLTVDTRQGVTVVPTAAIQRGPGLTFVYRVKPDETVEVQKIALGPSEGDQTVVESGLSPGDRVVTDGVDKLMPGAKVNWGKGGNGKPPADAGAKKAGPAEAPATDGPSAKAPEGGAKAAVERAPQ
ncbi:MAG: MdtA/MuxA family multidrug efflux RND transporter periplasmic adaptor subunit [Pirellulales bacterium]